MKPYDIISEQLTSMGLSPYEAREFIKLAKKINPTEKQQEAFGRELNQAIPFEGGMGFSESVVAMKRAMSGI